MKLLGPMTEITRDVATLKCGAGRIVCLECGGSGDWTIYHREHELTSGKCSACKGTGWMLVSV